MMRNSRRAGFTLFELILAVALSAVLLALVGTAITLYLSRVDAGNSRVEESQLARSILAKIADDIRGATIYQAQDTSGIAELMAASAEFDVDDIDAEQPSGNSLSGSLTPNENSSGSGSLTGNSSSLSSLSSSTSSSTSTQESQTNEPADTLPLGLNGNLNELYVDVTRLPRQEELFATVTGYSNAQLPASKTGAASAGAAMPAGVIPPTDIKSVHYFVRQGEAVKSGSAATTSLAPSAQQLSAGGLVRQEIPRTLRLGAEMTGDAAVLEGGQVLLAPEVVNIEFRYFNGTEVTDLWDMSEEQVLPRAVEVRIWLSTPGNETATQPYDINTLSATTREYRHTVYLPMSELSADSQMSGDTSSVGSTASSGTSSGGTSSSSSSSSGTGSSFGDK
jgi:prepilin-type N-terminal cleavage/methylation domain-containing protein